MKYRIFLVLCHVVKKVWDDVVLDTVVEVPVVANYWSSAVNRKWEKYLFPYCDVTVLTIDGKTSKEWQEEMKGIQDAPKD